MSDEHSHINSQKITDLERKVAALESILRRLLSMQSSFFGADFYNECMDKLRQTKGDL